MPTYQQEFASNCVITYYVPIELDTDETVFNGEYLKNKDGELVYFGLQDTDGNYDNNLKNIKNLSTCIKLMYYKDKVLTEDDNFSITLEYVNDTVAKIFINKQKYPLTLDNRKAQLMAYFNGKIYMFSIHFYPKICSYKYIFNVYSFQTLATNVNFSFDKLYYVCNYNGTGGTIDMDLLRKTNYINMDNNTYLNKTILMVAEYSSDNINMFKNNINSLIYTYYSSSYTDWYLCESGYTPKKLLETGYDEIYYLGIANNTYTIFDYGENKAYTHPEPWNRNGLFYLCAIDEDNQLVIPIFRTLPNNFNRPGNDSSYTYTTYILK